MTDNETNKIIFKALNPDGCWCEWKHAENLNSAFWWCEKCDDKVFGDSFQKPKHPDYTSESSPRSLLSAAEAEVERRGIALRYFGTVRELLDLRTSDPEIVKQFRVFTAPASIRARAAAEVLKEEG
jgi:hypothetical protein